ncbi:MAG: phage portal protein [Cyclobacteriaceae bacterium]
MSITSRIKTFSSNVAFLANVSLRGSLTNIDWFKDNFPGWFDAIGSSTSVSKRQAVKISTVYTCLNILGETFGSLPFDVKQDTPQGRVTRKDHPVYKLIHDRPNPFTTAFDFWSTIVKLIKGWGNAYAIIERANGEPSALWLVNPQDIQIIKHQKSIVYKITSTGQLLSHTDILHFKNFSLDGIIGLSALDENRVTMGHAKKLKEYNSALVDTRPPGYLSAETPPKDPNQKENIKKMFQVEKVGEIPLLYGGVKYFPFSLPADAVAYIESSDLTEQEIYGIFRIPPTLAQNYKRATFSNAEQQDLVFSKYSLATRTAIEQECNAKLFREDNYQSGQPLYTKFNLKGILAGDIKTRKEFYQMGLTLGLFSQNNVLDLEDMERFEGGDRRYIQGAMVPLDLVDDFVKKGRTLPTPSEEQKVSEEKKLQLRGILNGHYKEVIDILES